jgi:hypothetical protein
VILSKDGIGRENMPHAVAGQNRKLGDSGAKGALLLFFNAHDTDFVIIPKP